MEIVEDELTTHQNKNTNTIITPSSLVFPAALIRFDYFICIFNLPSLVDSSCPLYDTLGLLVVLHCPYDK